MEGIFITGYVSLVEADKILQICGDERFESWVALDMGRREECLKKAFWAVESQKYVGAPAERGAFRFPRAGEILVSDLVKAAQCAEALELAVPSGDSLDFAMAAGAVAEYSIGGFSEKFRDIVSEVLISREARRLLAGYMEGCFDVY